MERKLNLEGLLRDDDCDYQKPLCCSKCGHFLKYLGIGEYKCEECGFTEYDAYGKVRCYLERYPGANIVRIEKDTGVPQKTIKAFVRQGKFVLNKRGNASLLEVDND